MSAGVCVYGKKNDRKPALGPKALQWPSPCESNWGAATPQADEGGGRRPLPRVNNADAVPGHQDPGLREEHPARNPLPRQKGVDPIAFPQIPPTPFSLPNPSTTPPPSLPLTPLSHPPCAPRPPRSTPPPTSLDPSMLLWTDGSRESRSWTRFPASY